MTVIIFLLVLSVLVLVHELGHFIAAKKSGCDVEEFGIGFPPRLFSIKRGETIYSINALPLGGFVRIKGENGDDQPDERSFASRSYAWKAFIVAAGVLMNIVLAYVLITANLMIGVPTLVDAGDQLDRFVRLSDQQVAIVEVLPNSPAESAHLQEGDTIVSIDGQTPKTVDAVMAILAQTQTQAHHLQIQRGPDSIAVDVTPTMLQSLGHPGIGVGLSESATLSYPWYAALYYGLKETVNFGWLIITSFAAFIGQLFTGHSVSGEVAGPVGIAVLTGQAARLGLTHLLQFVAILSLNLAIINILPFPALDGSRLLMMTIEQFRGKKMNVNFEKWFHILGFAFLMMLMLFVTAQDIMRYKDGIWHSITHLFG